MNCEGSSCEKLWEVPFEMINLQVPAQPKNEELKKNEDLLFVTRKILNVESQRLEIERERLNIEKQRLIIEKNRWDLEKQNI
ncbi:uncharacterized protein LOC117100978 [Anneissia japonica]|uniref:uncharacterized protein LOC117100978 n=1 Tax=Anneissia japonica TaxID=1529436 RepID=UPI00142596D7|nr:uncharacterized protein LOC117100978 [Anneissia japonica]